MRKLASACLAIAACGVLGVSCKTTTGGAYGNSDQHANSLSFYAGARGYDDDEWEPVEEQRSVGFDFAHCPDWIGFEGGLFAARDHARRDGAEFTGKTAEFFGGLRLRFSDGIVHPYIGIGLASIFMKLDEEGVGSAHDGSVGGYAHVGATIDITKYLFVGLDVRGLRAGEVEVLGRERDVDYTQLALVVGFSF